MNKGMLGTQAAAEELGLTIAQFKRICKEKGIVPDDTYPNPHYRKVAAAH